MFNAVQLAPSRASCAAAGLEAPVRTNPGNLGVTTNQTARIASPVVDKVKLTKCIQTLIELFNTKAI